MVRKTAKKVFGVCGGKRTSRRKYNIQRTRLAKEKWKSQEDQNKQETRRTANSWQKEKDLQTGDSGLYHTTALYPALIKTKPMNGDRWLVQVKHLWRKSSSFDRIV